VRHVPPAPVHDVPADESAFPMAEPDDVAASEARVRYRTCGVEPVEADEGIRGLLVSGEDVVAVRRNVALDRRLASAREPVVDSIRGDLYVTTKRLVHVGDCVLTFDLEEIEDSALAGDTVLLLLGDGVGVALRTDRPRLLRVQIAAARAARASRPELRADRAQPSSRPEPASR